MVIRGHLFFPRLGSAWHLRLPQVGPKTVEPILAATASCNRLAGAQDHGEEGEEVLPSAFVAEGHYRCEGADEASAPCLGSPYGSLDTHVRCGKMFD